MLIRHVVSRMMHALSLSILLFILTISLVSTALLHRQQTSAENAPVPVQMTDGWSDPIGG